MTKREFSTGASRNSEEGKLDFEGFLSPLVLERFAQYMDKNRHLEDGTLRDSDNWQKLFGEDHYKICMKSIWRHFFSMWKSHRGLETKETIEESMMGLLFNVMAYAFKYLEEKDEVLKEKK